MLVVDEQFPAFSTRRAFQFPWQISVETDNVDIIRAFLVY